MGESQISDHRMGWAPLGARGGQDRAPVGSRVALQEAGGTNCSPGFGVSHWIQAVGSCHSVSGLRADGDTNTTQAPGGSTGTGNVTEGASTSGLERQVLEGWREGGR